jgi:AraC-like DNA-binding protein
MTAGAFQKHAEPSARLYVGGARAAFIGPSLRLAPHRIAVACLAVGLDDGFSLSLAGTDPVRSRTALIPPRVRHHLVAEGRMAFFYFDPLSDDADALDAGPCRADDLSRAVAERPDDFAAFFEIVGARALAPTDARVAAAIREVEARPQDFPTAASAASLAGISASLFQRRLRRAVGVPFRRYRLWRRMAVVAAELSRGATLTTAAHMAGFASSAHFSAAFRAMFGLAPSALLSTGVRIICEGDAG